MNDEQKNEKEQPGNSETSNQKVIEGPVREEQAHQHHQPSTSLSQQWHCVSIDKRFETGIALIGLFIAAILAVVAACQLSAMKDQTASMQGQLTEMKSGSEAAIASSRAWIMQTSYHHSVVGSKHHFSVTLKNYGHTPAFNIRIRWEVIYVEGQPIVYPKFTHWECPTSNKAGDKVYEMRPGIIADGGTLDTDFDSAILSEDQLRSIRDKTARLFLHGCITYRDVVTPIERRTELAGYTVGNFDGIGIYDAYENIE